MCVHNFRMVTMILCHFVYRVFASESHEMSTASRVGSASRKQAERELWALRDNVLRLQEDLAVSHAQLDAVTRQFNCLVDLLRKYVCFCKLWVSAGMFKNS